FITFMKWDKEFRGFIGDTFLEQASHLIEEFKDKESILPFLIVICYAKHSKDLIIPYTKGIKRLIQSTSIEEIEACIFYMKKKTNRYNKRQDCSVHPFILPILKVLGEHFLNQTGFIGLGVYGSFSLGTTNEYSDLDLMVVAPKPYDVREVRRRTKQFFKPFLPIPIDVKVTSIEDMNSELTIGMKKTVKGIAGDIKWKKSMN
ncbi:MAG: nucleotidyltransferase domain-containing protein, partial [Anaeroplasmataceae bacterium]|nr:nucleotidyltransferase domain-containing protein [Anaeroplasmataceae bacterium]